MLDLEVMDERGQITLVELLVASIVGLFITASALLAIDGARSSSTKTAARQEAVTQAEFAIARITRELRQATLATVQGSGVLDRKPRVRTTAGGSSALRRIRYDCSAPPGCVRKDCGTVSAGGTLVGTDCSGAQSTILTGVQSASFAPQLNGATLTVPPARETPALDFVTVRVSVRLDDFTAGREAVKDLDPVTLASGVEIANVEN